MNKSFKTLFTLFLGILFFIPTFTANSVAKEKFICVMHDNGNNFSIAVNWEGAHGCLYKISKDNFPKSYKGLINYFNDTPGAGVSRGIRKTSLLKITKKIIYFPQMIIVV